MKSTQVLPRWRRPVTGLVLTILFAFTILGSSVAAPTDSSEGLVLNYELGKTYTYDYETSSVIKLVGSSNEESQVQLKGQAFLTPTKRNDFVLTLGDFTLDVTSPNEKVAAPIGTLKGSSSRFTTERGVIKDFYVTGGESAWVANYHRAIVSIFNNYALQDSQHSQAFYLENDVSGSNCPTEYEITSDGTFTKRRDLNKCRDRDGGYSEQYGVPYTSTDEGEPTSDTSIRSSQECVQKYAQGVLNTAECSEVHRVTLLSSGKDAGGQAKVSAKIQFKSIGPGQGPVSTPSKPSTILFDHDGTDLKRTGDEAATGLIEGLTGKLCLSTGLNGRLSANTAPVFLTLKAKMRFVSTKVLEDVYGKLKSGKVCEAKDDHLKTLVKLYVDAASMAGSTDSIAFIANLVKSGAVSKNSQKRFRMFTSFADRPGEAALESMTNLISSNGTDLSPKYLLTASGIAYQYCLSVKEACETSKAYIALVNEIAKQTKENCGASGSGDQKKLKAAVTGLQALGNLNALTTSATGAISSCLEKSDRLKIHAFQAIRRDPCQESIKVTARQILANRKNPSHLRISAYLAISQCYAKVDSDAIRAFIKTEESIQVVSFIKSHRDNAGAACRDAAKLDTGLFDGVDLEKLIGRDPRKFSSALAYSNELETYSANVIYSEDSFLPKIVYGNSSTKLYGQDFGLIEFGAHLGGIEQDIMERMFGPNGEHPTTFQENTRRRPKRAGPAPTINQNEIEAFHSQVKPTVRTTEPSDVYIRVFGTTVYTQSLTLDNYFSSIAKNPPEPLFSPLLLERVLKGEEVDFTESYPLYGDELIIPTVSGLSLWIHNEGAAILSLKYSHSLSEDFVTFSPKFSPGISIANNMKMTIAGDIIEAGLRAETRIGVSTDIALTGTLTASDDHYGYDIRVALPPTDVKLVDASNELFWILQTRHADYDLKQKMKPLNPYVIDSGKKCAKYLPIITGIKACVQVQLPAFSGKAIPSFPLSGPAFATLELSPPAGAKELVIKFKVSKPDSSAKEKILSVEVDAPGSAPSVKSIIKSSVVYGSEGLEKFSVELDSPAKKAGFSGEKTMGVPGVHDFSYTVQSDGKEYKLFFKQRHNTNAAGTKSSSYNVRYKLPNQEEITIWSLDLKGSLQGGATFEHSIDFKLNDINSITVKEYVGFSASVDGEWGDVAGKKLTAASKFSCHGKQVFSMNEVFTRGVNNSLLYESETKFLWAGEEKDIKVKGTLKKDRTGFNIQGTTSSSSSPRINSEFDSTWTNAPGHREIIFNLKQKGPGAEGGIIKSVYTWDHVDGVMKTKYDGKVIYPPLDINLEKSYEVENTPEKFSVTYQYSCKNEKIAEIKFIYNKPATTYDANFLAVYSGKKFTLASKNSVAGGHLIFEHNVGVQPGFKASVKTDIFESRDGEGVWKNRVTTVTSDAFPQTYVYSLKYDSEGQNRAPKLFTNGQGTISVSVVRDSVPMATLSFVNQKTAGDQHTFKISSIVENVYTTNFELKCNPQAERIEIITSVQSPPKDGPERFLKLVLTGKAAGDKPGERTLGFSLDVKPNGIADPEQSISISNSNRFRNTGGSFSLEGDNNVQIFGKTRTTKVKLSGSNQGNAKLSFGFDHTDPEKKNTKLETSVETQNLVDSKFVKVKHELVSAGEKTLGNFEFAQKLNPQDNTGEIVTSYEQNGQKEYEVKLSNSKVGSDQIVVLTVNGLGKVLRTPIQYEIRVEGGPGKARVMFLGGYSDPNSSPIYFNLNTEKTAGTALHKYIIDAAFDPLYKQEKGAAFSGKVTFAYGFKSAGDFDGEATGIIAAAGVDGKNVYSFNRVIKASPGLFKLEFSSKSEKPGKAPVVGEAKIKVENPADRLLVNVNLQHDLLSRVSGTGQNRLDFDLDTTKDINNLNLLLQAKLPSTKFEALSVKIQRKVSPDGSSKVSSLSGKLDEKTIDLDTNILLTGTKKTADVTLKLNDEAPTKLSFKYDLAGGAQSAEAIYEWGNDRQYIKSKGTITHTPNNGFTAKFEFDVPTKDQQWTLEVNRVVAEPKKSFSFVATSPKTKQNLKVELAKEGNENTGFSWNAGINVDLAAPYDKYDIDGTIKAVLDKNAYVQGGSVPGSSFVFSMDYTVGEEKRYRSLSLDSGKSASEKRLNGKFCLSKENCFDLKTLVKDERLEKSFQLSLTSSFKEDIGYVASVSSSYKTSEDKQARLTTFEYSLDNRIYKQKTELGVKLYKKPGNLDELELAKADISAIPTKVYTRGFEIAVPERTYGAQVASGEWDNVDTEAREISLWFDKKNSPNQKLVLGFSKTGASVQEEGQGKDIVLTLRHHKLQRDMKVRTRYRYGITSKVFDLKTEIDIFKTAQAKVIFSVELTHDVPTETYGLQYGLKSDGQGFSVMTNCEKIHIDFPNFTATCTQNRKAPNAKDVNYEVNIKTDENEELIQIQEGGTNVFYYKAAFHSDQLGDPADSARTASSSGATTELRLPGMTDTRIINFRWSQNPVRFTITTNPSSSKDVTAFWIGATGVQGGGFEISRTDETGKKQELGHFAAVVRSKQLQIDLDWSKEHIASYLEYVVKRGQEVEQLATKTCANLNTQLWQSQKAIRKSLKDSSQDFQPLVEWYETQFNQIGKKYNLAPVSLPRGQALFVESEIPPKSALVATITSVNKCLKSCAASINAFLDSLAKRETLPTPEAVKARSLKIREFAETVANKIRGFVAATKELKEKYPFLKKNARKFREKVVDKLQSAYEQTKDDLNDLFPYPEVNHFLDHFNDYFEVALLEPEKISQANKTEILGDLEKAVNKILSNSYSINFAQGKISAKLPLLGKLEAFRKKQVPYQDFTKKESECIKELVEDPSSILPPVNATAFIIGNTNYVTFDGIQGNFERTCQYLMASDFVNKNLSVVLDLGDSAADEGVGSTLFVTNHKTTIGITRGASKHQVVANGKVVNLENEPSRVGAFVVYEEASYVIIEGDMGITLGCTYAFNLCAVQVSGFYHGKLQGLFGKYNNEPSDDWTLPNGQVTTNDGIFQKGWKLDQKCSGVPIPKSEEKLSLLYKALRRTDLDYDTFFSRSRRSPHRSIY